METKKGRKDDGFFSISTSRKKNVHRAPMRTAASLASWMPSTTGAGGPDATLIRTNITKTQRERKREREPNKGQSTSRKKMRKKSLTIRFVALRTRDGDREREKL